MIEVDRRIGVFNRDDSPMEFGAWDSAPNRLREVLEWLEREMVKTDSAERLLEISNRLNHELWILADRPSPAG